MRVWADYMVTGRKEGVLRTIEFIGAESEGQDANRPTDPNSPVESAKAVMALQCRFYEELLEVCKEQLQQSSGALRKALEEVINEVDGSVSVENWAKNAPALKPVTGPKGWALGCSAVLTEYNIYRHDTLALAEITIQSIDRAREGFDEWWGIRTKRDLLKQLRRLKKRGHRASFRELGEKLSGITEEQYQQLLNREKGNAERLNEYRIVKRYYSELGDRGILAWDYSRYIYLCRNGYMSGFLSEQEAWELIMPIARELQKRFDSWEQMGTNYLIGRQYWSYKQTQKSGRELEDAYQRLLDMKSSPWNRYSWDMDLGDDEPNETGESDAVGE